MSAYHDGLPHPAEQKTKRCADCRFSNEERPDPKMIKPVLMCRYGPLHPVAVMIPAGQGMVTQIRALCPAVADGDWCHRFEARIVLSG